MSTVISFFAGPCSGKSVSAAYIFAELKRRGVNAELVSEYVKDWVWEGRPMGVYDQFYFTAKQIKKESRLLGKADVVITDCPVWLGAYYAERISPPLIRNGVESAVQGYYLQSHLEGHRHIDIWLNRPDVPYDERGRWHTEIEAKQVDENLRPFLVKRGVNLIEVQSDFKQLDELLDRLEL